MKIFSLPLRSIVKYAPPIQDQFSKKHPGRLIDEIRFSVVQNVKKYLMM